EALERALGGGDGLVHVGGLAERDAGVGLLGRRVDDLERAPARGRYPGTVDVELQMVLHGFALLTLCSGRCRWTLKILCATVVGWLQLRRKRGNDTPRGNMSCPAGKGGRHRRLAAPAPSVRFRSVGQGRFERGKGAVARVRSARHRLCSAPSRG